MPGAIASLYGADHRKTDTGIAACGFYDRIPRGQLPFFFRGLDHGEGDPVFDRTAGVAAFELCPYLSVILPGKTIETYERSIPDQT
jgi:hypothetical protein